MDTFISFILITIATVYILGWLGRLLLRRWLMRKQRQFAEQFGQQGGFTYKQYSWGGQRTQRQKQAQQQKEGEVRVENTVATQKKVSRSVGDYVEYEEVTEVTETEYTETKQ